MDVAPGFAEPGMANQNRTRQKGLADTCLHQHGGSFFAYFLVDTRK